MWLTVDKATLKNDRNAYEYRATCRGGISGCQGHDRGGSWFGDQKLYRVLTEELKFDYLIRFRGKYRRDLS
jgi:hypothetical protein